MDVRPAGQKISLSISAAVRLWTADMDIWLTICMHEIVGYLEYSFFFLRARSWAGKAFWVVIFLHTVQHIQ